MATKSMAYDNPAYQAVFPLQQNIAAGSGAVSAKFTAFTSMLVKSIQVIPTAAGTSNDVINSIQISGTTTTTTAITTYGSSVATATNVVSSASLAQGDLFYLLKGTDATVAYSATLELRLQPTASVTV